jgi:hypothetical protein
MDANLARSDEHQSGQRFLDSSAPRLIRHAAFAETAGGVIPLPAGKDQKLSRESEGGALSGRAAPMSSSTKYRLIVTGRRDGSAVAGCLRYRGHRSAMPESSAMPELDANVGTVPAVDPGEQRCFAFESPRLRRG